MRIILGVTLKAHLEVHDLRSGIIREDLGGHKGHVVFGQLHHEVVGHLGGAREIHHKQGRGRTNMLLIP